MQRLLFLLLVLLFSCKKEEKKAAVVEKEAFIAAMDLSFFPEMSAANPSFYDQQGNQVDFLALIKSKGINTVRLRVWVNPVSQHSGLEEVKQFSQTLKAQGFKIWLSLHYSDTWADPGQQQTPAAWQGLSLAILKDSLYNYTQQIVTQIQPEYIQIGNEINPGFLHPQGNINNFANFYGLLETGIAAVRDHAPQTKIILHYAGIENATWFFNGLQALNYDIIGLSYYPLWHGKSLPEVKSKLAALSTAHNKPILIAETAYPFTLAWNDWTNNVVGLDTQLILPDYPATPIGQRDFVARLRSMIEETPQGLGICYWGGEWIAWRGNQATNGSSWENQALFDFQNRALPALRELQRP